MPDPLPDPLPDPALTWIDRLGLTAPGQLALFVAAALVALPVPDMDLLAMGVLHHRSILTHSVLPGLLPLLARRSWGVAPAAGALLGIAVHLSADVLSPPVGFGRVWLPEPLDGSLGAWSPFWLALNAILAAALSLRLLLRGGSARPTERRARQLVAAATAAGAAAGYGMLNEGSLPAVLTAFVALALGYGLHRLLPG